MKRKVLIALCSMLIVPCSLLFATGGSQSRAATAGSLPFVEFDWYFQKVTQNDDAIVFEAANRYIVEKINARINFVSMPGGDLGQRMPVLINSGVINGIGYFGGNAGNYITNTNNGAYLPLDDLLTQYAPATKALFNTTVWDGMKINNRIYGVPTLKDNAYIIGATYNATMAERLGINMSNVRWKNFTEIESLLMEVKQKRDAAMPQYRTTPLIQRIDWPSEPTPVNFALEVLAPNPYAALNIPGIMDVAGYDSETVFNLYDTPEYLRHVQTMTRLRANNILNSSTDLQWDGNNWNPGLFLWINWGSVIIAENAISNDFVTKFIPPARTWVDTGNYQSAGSAIMARTRDPQRAMMAIELMNTDSYLATIMRFGVEGQHYLRNAAGKMVFEGSPRNSDPSSRNYYLWYGPYLGNVTIVEAPENLSGADNALGRLLLDYNNNARQAHMGFVFDPSPVEQYVAACNAVVGEYQRVQTQGELPEAQVAASVAEFRQKLRDNNVQRIIDEAQRQLNAWKARR